MNKKSLRVISVALGTAITASSFATLAGCGGSKKDSIALMTDALSGLFNPFYATSGTDMDVIGMTQIGMLSTDDKGDPTWGENEATVVLDCDIKSEGENSVYTFVLKNNLVFSDGFALTMNDVFFNIYEYLDPVYTGSSTMYSTKIVGLKGYRTQQHSSGDSSLENDTNREASNLATGRIQEIIDIYVEANENYNPGTASYNVTAAQMNTTIDSWDVTANYTDAVGENTSNEDDATYYKKLIKEDYRHVSDLFMKELKTDYETARDAFDLTTDTSIYKKWNDKDHFGNDVFKFFYYEGLITPKYAKGADNKDDKTNIESFENMSLVSANSTQEKAIQYVYDFYMQTRLDAVMYGTGTANTIRTEYEAKAKEVLLHDLVTDGLEIPRIDGIVSLGHTTDVTSVSVNNKTYNVAHEHDETFKNSDGSINKNYGAVKNKSEYDVLRITLESPDPKAIYNFGFSVAPAHYYTADAQNPYGVQIDIKNDVFGVTWGSYDFQSKTIQSDLHNGVPVGAGPFMATDSDNRDNPTDTGFWNAKVVYFKRNDLFTCLGEQFAVKAEKLRFQEISSNNALDALASGQVDYATPQLTLANSERIAKLKSKGIESMAGWQLGYGYIGVNASKVPNIYLRRAIMAAMQTELSCQYYQAGTCKPIAWPMSSVSWAYPDTEENLHSYTYWDELKSTIESGKTDAERYPVTINKIKELMTQAAAHGDGYSQSDLKIKFTIAGATITEHPTYAVFKQAAAILNACGWEVEVVADSQALVKLSTGALAVWAAAWGSTIDPDMYQVYSPYSSATSVKAWGYPAILNDTNTYAMEYDILTREGGLSDLIDEGRSITDPTRRKEIYQRAMSYVLDLAVEMPVYQRQTLYVYNAKTITGIANCIVPETGLVNPFSSPLSRIWEISLIK